MADDNKILLKIQIEKGGSTVTLKNFENQVIKSGVAIKDLNNSIGNFTTSKLKMNGQVKVTTDQFKRLEKSVGGFKTAAGASTSATLELGRVLSDMPYGIRGVANNLQQLASNLFFMSKATDAATGKSVGFMGAIGNLLKGLIGPAGILIAFQGIIAAFDYFSGGAEKASNSASDFEEELNDLVNTLDKLSISQANTNEKILEYIEYRVLAQKTDKEVKDLTEKLADLDEDIADKKKLNAEFELNFSKKTKGITLEQFKALSEQEKISARRVAQMSNLTARIRDYEKRVGKVGELETKRIETYNKSISVIKKLKEEQDKLTAAEEGSLKGLKNTLKDQKEKRETLSGTSEKYKELTKAINETQKAIEAIEGKKTKGGVDVFAGKFVESYYNEIAGLGEIIKDEDFDEISDSAKIEGTIILKPKIDNPDPEDLEDLTFYLDKYTQLMSGIGDFLQAEADRELTIEQNKTNALNEELNKRLLNESLSETQRKSIQDQILKNDEDLRVKQNKIKKKAFDTQKALNISMAIANTIAAGISAANQSYGGAFAKIAAMTAVIGAGMAQVAIIARQKFQPDSPNTPINTGGGGASGGTSERADPSFNIVGRSNDNLLINAIQAQFGKPLKAYVVSRDVTTQQQLDGMIVGQAGT